jgi:tetratricopeptide (TPR) repeat protein
MGESRSGLGYSGRLVARAAVKAKQQAKAKAQPPKPRGRGRRRHSGGGNPNQQLFFVKLRRGQKWLYGLLALVFALGFVGIGVGSGNGAGLNQLYTGLFGGGGGGSVSKAQDEIKKDPAKGYRLLATAYEQEGHPVLAINALQTYLGIKKDDAASWSELGGLQLSQGNTYATQYQQAQRVAQAADPSAPFLPGGTLGSAVGQNPTYQGASQTASARTSLLYQKAVGAYGSAVTAYQKASNLHPRNATYLQELATAAGNAGNSKVEVAALRKYLQVYPNAPGKKNIEKQIKALSQASTPTVQSGNGH